MFEVLRVHRHGRMTKWKGKAASIAPFAVFAVCLGALPAQATCTNPSAGVYECSGAITAPTTYSSTYGGLMDVTVLPGTTMDGGTAGSALRVTHNPTNGADTEVTLDGDMFSAGALPG